jgi:hypothetical protein
LSFSGEVHVAAQKIKNNQSTTNSSNSNSSINSSSSSNSVVNSLALPDHVLSGTVAPLADLYALDGVLPTLADDAAAVANDAAVQAAQEGSNVITTPTPVQCDVSTHQGCRVQEYERCYPPGRCGCLNGYVRRLDTALCAGK